MKESVGNILQKIDIGINVIDLYGYDIIETSLSVESTCFIYFPIIERGDYCGQNLKSVIRRYFNNFIQNVVNFLIISEEYSDKRLRK